MRTPATAIALLGIVMAFSVAMADPIIFFEEQFNGPALDPAAWHTEILTSGPRWCQDTYDFWGPGSWVEEGIECHGVAAQSPYGSVIFSDGMLHFSPTNDRAYPLVVSRLPGSVQVFPAAGDFTLRLRLRYDRVTPWGSGLAVFRTESTEPVGDNPSIGLQEDIALHLACDASTGGIAVLTALGGSYDLVAVVSVPTDPHEFVLDCVGSSFTISVDGQVVFGPVTSTLRPTAVLMGDPPIAFWYPTDWTEWSIDYFRVDVPGPVSTAVESWGSIRARFRNYR